VDFDRVSESVKEVGLRWRSIVRQMKCVGNRNFTIQVVEYFVDYNKIFDAGDDFHGATASTAGLDVDTEHTLGWCWRTCSWAL
jgi:hypothetical protein